MLLVCFAGSSRAPSYYDRRSRFVVDVWDSCRVHSVIILLVMTRPWIGVLVEVHEYVLNLCLLWGIHHHHNWLPWCHLGTWLLIAVEILATGSRVLLLMLSWACSSIVSVESLGSGPSSGLLCSLLLSRRTSLIVAGEEPCSHWRSTCRSLSLRCSLMIAALHIIVWRRTVSKVSVVSCVLLLVPRIPIVHSCILILLIIHLLLLLLLSIEMLHILLSLDV